MESEEEVRLFILTVKVHFKAWNLIIGHGEEERICDKFLYVI